MSRQGKVALVTGASRGMGQAIAPELGRNGAVVVETATSELCVERIRTTCKANGIEGFGLRLDVRGAAAVNSVLS
ncbi:SDR family NAD(P)-dependent oxidoreductase, partial [Pseudomonas syringae]